jgi:hypothetical protein
MTKLDPETKIISIHRTIGTGNVLAPENPRKSENTGSGKNQQNLTNLPTPR